MTVRTDLQRRQNGLASPYSPPQTAAFVALVATFFQFIIFVAPLMPTILSLFVTIYFVSLVAGVVYFGVQTQIKDPIDLHLVKDLRCVKVEHPDDMEYDYFEPSGVNKWMQGLYQKLNGELDAVPEEPLKQCWICDTMVAEHSMHCKFCNKCVYHFDHHCMWLNTCVGSHNYEEFFRTMCFIFAMELSHFIIQVVLLTVSFVNNGKNLAGDWFAADLEIFVHAVLIFFIVFNIVSLILIGQLLHFHLELQRDGITTYQYIVQDHKRRRDQMRLEDELRSQRSVKIAAARERGDTLEVLQLRIGDLCRNAGCGVLDPLDLPKPNPPSDGNERFGNSLGGEDVGRTVGEGDSDDYDDENNTRQVAAAENGQHNNMVEETFYGGDPPGVNGSGSRDESLMNGKTNETPEIVRTGSKEDDAAPFDEEVPSNLDEGPSDEEFSWT